MCCTALQRSRECLQGVEFGGSYRPTTSKIEADVDSIIYRTRIPFY